MKTLLDTDVISQATKLPGNHLVLQWLAQQEEGTVFLSVATLAELRSGTDGMPKGKRKERIAAWLENDLRAQFQNCILDIDPAVADRAGALMAHSTQAGHNTKWMDALIAATALTHGMQLATLNRKDFEKLGVSLVSFE